MKRRIMGIGALVLAGILFTGCGINRNIGETESIGMRQIEPLEVEEETVGTQVSGVPRGEKVYDKDINESVSNMINNENETRPEPESKEVEINGKKYLEIGYIEDSQSLDYIFEGYVLTMISSWEELGDDLYVNEDGDRFSFDVILSNGSKIEGKLITGYYDKKAVQFGDTDPLEFSDLFKDNKKSDNRSTVSFGKAYYDYEETLYVDVMITVPGKFYTDTVVIDLKD